MTSFYRQWLHLRLRKWVVHPVCRTLYRDMDTDIGRSIVVAGAGRSGTTWLGKIISSQLPCRVMFEPFHSRYVEEFRRFHYFHYMRPETDNDELHAYCHKVLSGRIRHRWIDREVDVIRPQFRIVKEIRMNLFLRWFSLRFPEVPLLFILRHPCAVVLSRMQRGWDSDGDLASFLAQDDLLEDYLGDKMDIIEGARTEEEKHALVWSISNVVPLRQFTGSELNILRYEDLVDHPEKEVPRLFRSIGQDYHRSVFAAMERPSSSTPAGSAVLRGRPVTSDWKSVLTERQIDAILAIVEAFGLGHLYADDRP
jgi:hypothetical protein